MVHGAGPGSSRQHNNAGLPGRAAEGPTVHNLCPCARAKPGSRCLARAELARGTQGEEAHWVEEAQQNGLPSQALRGLGLHHLAWLPPLRWLHAVPHSRHGCHCRKWLPNSGLSPPGLPSPNHALTQSRLLWWPG